jgi:hypothetical protein
MIDLSYVYEQEQYNHSNFDDKEDKEPKRERSSLQKE